MKNLFKTLYNFDSGLFLDFFRDSSVFVGRSLNTLNEYSQFFTNIPNSHCDQNIILYSGDNSCVVFKIIIIDKIIVFYESFEETCSPVSYNLVINRKQCLNIPS